MPVLSALLRLCLLHGCPYLIPDLHELVQATLHLLGHFPHLPGQLGLGALLQLLLLLNVNVHAGRQPLENIVLPCRGHHVTQVSAQDLRHPGYLDDLVIRAPRDSGLQLTEALHADVDEVQAAVHVLHLSLVVLQNLLHFLPLLAAVPLVGDGRRAPLGSMDRHPHADGRRGQRQAEGERGQDDSRSCGHTAPRDARHLGLLVGLVQFVSQAIELRDVAVKDLPAMEQEALEQTNSQTDPAGFRDESPRLKEYKNESLSFFLCICFLFGLTLDLFCTFVS